MTHHYENQLPMSRPFYRPPLILPPTRSLLSVLLFANPFPPPARCYLFYFLQTHLPRCQIRSRTPRLIWPCGRCTTGASCSYIRPSTYTCAEQSVARRITCHADPGTTWPGGCILDDSNGLCACHVVLLRSYIRNVATQKPTLELKEQMQLGDPESPRGRGSALPCALWAVRVAK